jgi:hypothetical protein
MMHHVHQARDNTDQTHPTISGIKPKARGDRN